MIDGMTDDQLRAEATAERDLHNPELQDDNPYERCAHCNYTRHPCTTFDLATTILELLDREKRLVAAARAVWAHVDAVAGDTEMIELRDALELWP